MAQSLFFACKSIIRNPQATTQNVGGYDIDFEVYSQKDIDKNVEAIKRGEASGCTFGDSDQSKIVMICGDEITIPSGFNLTPTNPKKSLVIFCNKFTNNGTVSMYKRAPYLLPHDYLIMAKSDGMEEDILIPAIANNQVGSNRIIGFTTTGDNNYKNFNGIKGHKGISRNCGSGGGGLFTVYQPKGCLAHEFTSGSGYAFGGGAGSGGFGLLYEGRDCTSFNYNVDPTYPMKGGNGCRFNVGTSNAHATGGVGNPIGTNTGGSAQDWGCGGRIIIFCVDFENNGTLNVNGTNSTAIPSGGNSAYGGASGAGAIDYFYTNLLSDGTMSANGGVAIGGAGDGGDGCITPFQWNREILYRETLKKFSKDNWQYLFGQFADRWNAGE